MIRHSLRAAVAAAVFVVEASSQSATRPSEPRERTQRSQPEPRTSHSPSAPNGETKGRSKETSPIERARAYLEKHPEVRAKLFAKADSDGDGKLSVAEREQMKRLVTSALGEMKENVQERHDERTDRRDDRQDDRQDGRQDRRDDRQEDRRDDRRDGTGGSGRGTNASGTESTEEWDIDASGRITMRDRKTEDAKGTDGQKSGEPKKGRGRQNTENDANESGDGEPQGGRQRGRERSAEGQRGSRERTESGTGRAGNRSRNERK